MPPPWYWGNTHLVIEILEKSEEKLGYGQYGFAPSNMDETDPYYDEWVDYYYIGYHINVIMASHAVYMPFAPEIYIPDFLADKIAQSDKWFIEIDRLTNINSKEIFGLKRSLYTNDYTYLSMLPVINDKIVFTEQFSSLFSDWFNPDIDNYRIIENLSLKSIYSNLAFVPLLQPPLTAPVFGSVIAYNEQVLRGDWSVTLGTCDLHRREFNVGIDDKLFYDGMTLDELREYFESWARANGQIKNILPEIDSHLKMLFALMD